MKTRWKGVVLPIILLLLWQLQSQRGVTYAATFVPLGAIADAAVELWRSDELQGAIGSSLWRACVGLALGVSSGMTIGLGLALIRPLDRLFGPIFQALRQVPLFGWIPLIGLWLGSGEVSRLFVVALGAFYPVMLNTYEGVAKVERRYIEVADVLRLPPTVRLFRLALPAAMPAIFTGISQAVAIAWIAAVASEMLFASGPGLGNSMLMAEAGARMDVVLVCVALIGVLGFAMNTAINRLGSHLLRWREIRQG